MYTLFTDETNTQPSRSGKFFVYGGLLVPNDVMPELHSIIEDLRDRSGFQRNEELKFNSRSRPDHVDIATFNKTKADVIDNCIRLGCKFIAMYILHDMIKKQSQEDRISWGANCLIKSFNEFLRSPLINDYGTVVADQYHNLASIFRDKFQSGLEHSSGPNYIPNRILGFYISFSGCSHLVSAADIIIGSFSYCINNPTNEDVARAMHKQIKGMQYSVTEHPFDIRVPEYKAEYDGLKAKLADLETEKAEEEFPF